MRNWGAGGKYRQEPWRHAGTDLMHKTHLHPPHGYLHAQTAPTSKMNEAGAEASVASATQADHSSAALGCVMSAGTTHASNSSAVRKPSSSADSRSDRPL